MNEITFFAVPPSSVEQAGLGPGEAGPALKPSPMHTPRQPGSLAYGPILHRFNRQRAQCVECGKPFVTVVPRQIRCSPECKKAWERRYKKRANARRPRIIQRIAAHGTKADMRIPDRRKRA